MDLIQIALIVFILYYCIIYKRLHVKQSALISVALFTIQFLYRAFDTVDGSVEISVGTVVTAILCMAFILMKDDERARIFRIFIIIFAITLIPGMIVSCFNLLNISLPSTILQSAESIKVQSNLQYRQTFFSVILENPWWGAGYRKLCGIYDEPGRVGTIAGMLLPALPLKSKLKLDKGISYSIILGGLMSLSLAFYVLLALFIFIKLLERKKMTMKKWLIWLMFLCGTMGIFYVFATTNEYFQNQIIRRFTLQTIITDNNRVSDAFESIYRPFLSSPDVWLGVGNGNTVIKTVDAAGYQIIVYTFGIVGFSLICLWVCFMGITFSKKNRNALLMFVFFMLSFYQRGWIFPFYHILILCGGISFIKEMAVSSNSKIIKRVGVT